MVPYGIWMDTLSSSHAHTVFVKQNFIRKRYQWVFMDGHTLLDGDASCIE